MFSTKKSHSWYWYTAGSLLFCVAIFTVARFFLNAAKAFDATKKKKRGSKEEPLFI